jgi:hypothetical protein
MGHFDLHELSLDHVSLIQTALSGSLMSRRTKDWGEGDPRSAPRISLVRMKIQTRAKPPQIRANQDKSGM